MILKNKLSNGIRVISEHMPSFRSVSMAVWVRAGSVLETGEESGASHFIEHMLFKGTSKRTAEQIAAEMDSIGGNLNAFTSKECTCVYAKVLDEHMDRAAYMLSDLVFNSSFLEEDIEREKGVVCEEIMMTEDSPEDLVHENLCTLLYENTPLAGPILGTKQTVSAFTRATLINYMEKHYTPENIVISIAGSFELDKLLATLEAAFANKNHSSVQTQLARPKSILAPGRRFRADKKDIEQVHVCLGLPGYPAGEVGQYDLFVLNNALGGSMSSRLFQKIREAKGLAYSIYSYPSSFNDTGYFTLYAGTGEATAEQVAQLMLMEIDDVVKHGISKDEFIRAKEQLKGSYMLAQESTSARSNAIGKMELLRGKVATEEDILKKIEGITMDGVMAAVAHSLDVSRMSASIVGRVEDKGERIKKALGLL